MRISRVMKTISGIILIFCLVATCNSQTKDNLDNWLKRELFETSRQDIEKVFGQGSTGISDKHSLFYKTDYGDVNVIYSTGDCVTGKRERVEFAGMDSYRSFLSNRCRTAKCEKVVNRFRQL